VHALRQCLDRSYRSPAALAPLSEKISVATSAATSPANAFVCATASVPPCRRVLVGGYPE
jgi:hypothetical protein